jgi:hypothetical protein
MNSKDIMSREMKVVNINSIFQEALNKVKEINMDLDPVADNQRSVNEPATAILPYIL